MNKQKRNKVETALNAFFWLCVCVLLVGLWNIFAPHCLSWLERKEAAAISIFTPLFMYAFSCLCVKLEGGVEDESSKHWREK